MNDTGKKIRIIPSSSTVPVIPVNGQSCVPMRANKAAFFDAKLDDVSKRTDELEKEVADLQVNKQPLIKTIHLETPYGTLTPEQLLAVINNDVNRFIFNNSIYYLSYKSGNIKKYYSSLTEPVEGEYLNQINVDITTGNYAIVSTSNITWKDIEDHINDTSIHVTSAQKTFWDNKVTAETEILNLDSEEYKLLLKKD